MQVGDILDGPQLDGLPVGSVVVHDEDGGWGFNTVTRAASGYSWYSQSRSSDGHHDYYNLGEIVVGDWTVVHLPAVPALKVGDVIETFEQSKTLPVGTVVVDITEKRVNRAPAIKVADGAWLFWDVEDSAPETTDSLVDHKILHIPARANTGAGSTAA